MPTSARKKTAGNLTRPTHSHRVSAVAVADRATTRMLAGQDARHPTGRGTRNAASCQANVP